MDGATVLGATVVYVDVVEGGSPVAADVDVTVVETSGTDVVEVDVSASPPHPAAVAAITANVANTNPRLQALIDPMVSLSETAA